MRKTDYTNASQQRCLRILKILSEYLDGLTITEIAQLTDGSPDKVTRDLYNLELAGFAEREGEYWKQGKAVTQMFRVFSKSLQARLIKTINEALKIIRAE